LGDALPLQADVREGAAEHDAAMWRESQRTARVLGTAGATGPREAEGDEEWWFAARFASGMPPELGPGARAHILATAEEKERAAPEKKKVGLEKARAAALLAAREAMLGVLGKLAHHLAAVVGRWRGRLSGREVASGGRGDAVGPSPHGAPPPPPAEPRRVPKRTAAEVEEVLLEVQSQEQAAGSRAERLAGRAEGRRAAAGRAAEAVGARPIHISSQMGLVAQRRLRAKGWEAGWAATEARRAVRARAEGGMPPPLQPRAERGSGRAGETEDGQPGGLGVGGSAGGGDAADRRATELPRGEGIVGTGGLQSARAWAEEAEERQMRQQEEDVGGRWRRAKVEATAKRAVASTRQEVVRREEEGLRLAEELSEDRLLVALETLELAAAAGRARRRSAISSVRHGSRRTSSWS